jgi:hypothetical protein
MPGGADIVFKVFVKAAMAGLHPCSLGLCCPIKSVIGQHATTLAQAFRAFYDWRIDLVQQRRVSGGLAAQQRHGFMQTPPGLGEGVFRFWRHHGIV